MEQKPNFAVVMDAQTTLNKEECALGMGRIAHEESTTLIISS